MQEKSKLDCVMELLSLRRVVTFLLTVTFCYMTVVGYVTLEQFLPVLTIVIGYYFGRNESSIFPADEDDKAERRS